MRKWVGQNSDIEPSVMFRKLYDISCNVLQAASIPRLVLILADYGYKSAFVVDQEINLVAGLTEIMMECEFK
jgi:replication factor C small subunit